MTKRILALALLTALLLTGCQHAPDAGDAYHPATDSDYLNVSQGDYAQYAEGSKGYYISVGGFLMYLDHETLTTMPLCARPNCLHQAETDVQKRELCDAFFPHKRPWSFTFYQDGYVYVCAPATMVSDEFELTRMEEDGTQRTVLLTFPCHYVSFACIHRGNLYYAAEAYDEEGALISRVFERPLTQKTGESKVIYQAEENKDVSHNLFSGLFAYGNRLYLDEAVGTNRASVRIIDLKTYEVTVIPFPDAWDTVMSRFIYNDRLYLNYAAVSELAAYTMPPENVQYSCKLDGTDLRLEGNLRNCYITADEQYIYCMTWQGDGSFEDFALEKLHIMNRDMEDVCVFDFDELTVNGIMTDSAWIEPMHGDKLLLHTFCSDGTHGIYAFDRAEIESGAIYPVEVFRYKLSDYI